MAAGETRRLSRGDRWQLLDSDTRATCHRTPPRTHCGGAKLYPISTRHLRVGVHRASLIRARRRLERGQVRRSARGPCSGHFTRPREHAICMRAQVVTQQPSCYQMTRKTSFDVTESTDYNHGPTSLSKRRRARDTRTDGLTVSPLVRPSVKLRH